MPKISEVAQWVTSLPVLLDPKFKDSQSSVLFFILLWGEKYLLKKVKEGRKEGFIFSTVGRHGGRSGRLQPVSYGGYVSIAEMRRHNQSNL